MKKSDYKPVKHAKGSPWTIWVKPIMKGYGMACCDCALVHTMQFRIQDGRVWFRVRRAIGLTKKLRKRERIIVRPLRPSEKR